MIADISWHEYQMAAQVGVSRKSQSISLGHKDRYGSVWNPINDIGWSVVSAVSELAVAKCLKMYWDGSVNTFSRPDLEGIEVKAQLHHSIDPHKTSNFLVVKPNADDELVHVLVLVHSNTRYEVVGFIKGKNAKIKQFERQVNNRPPFYAVPIDELTDMRML